VPSPATQSSPCEVDDGTDEDLEPLLTRVVPAGYEQAPDEAEDTRPTDLDLAAFFVGTPEERDVLAELGFRRGYQRLWYAPEGADDLIVHLYEFCDARGATGYLRHTRERLLSGGSVEIDVDDVPDGGSALLQAGDDESFVAILQVNGPFYVEIGAYGGPPREPLAELAARARNLGAAQLADLP
jgi:hypothetical protein